jgi:hypothetical protein
MPTDVKKLFQALATQLGATLHSTRQVLTHPTTKGDIAETSWKRLLRNHLPSRYSVDGGFVIDSTGASSEQIDLLIYDRQYSTLVFNVDEAVFVPAESVYAVLEIKPELHAENIGYAGAKAASVRRLKRTSAPIRHAGGMYVGREPPSIIAGILCLASPWKTDFGDRVAKHLAQLETQQRLDVGCALHNGAFEASYQPNRVVDLECRGTDSALVFFYLRLLRQLQSIGTVAAIDYGEYEKFI